MQLATQAGPFRFSEPRVHVSKGKVWSGRVISGLAFLFLLFDSVTKIIREPHVVAAAAQTGIDEAKLVVIGSILAVCLVLYVIPRTAPVGALLLTAYLGGATAANLLFNQPVPLIFFPVVFGVLVWLGLYLRDDRLRVLIAPGR